MEEVVTIILSILQVRKLTLKKLLAEVTQLISDRGVIKPKTAWTQNPFSFHYTKCLPPLDTAMFLKELWLQVAVFIQEKAYTTWQYIPYISLSCIFGYT